MTESDYEDDRRESALGYQYLREFVTSDREEAAETLAVLTNEEVFAALSECGDYIFDRNCRDPGLVYSRIETLLNLAIDRRVQRQMQTEMHLRAQVVARRVYFR